MCVLVTRSPICGLTGGLFVSVISSVPPLCAQHFLYALIRFAKFNNILDGNQFIAWFWDRLLTAENIKPILRIMMGIVFILPPFHAVSVVLSHNRHTTYYLYKLSFRILCILHDLDKIHTGHVRNYNIRHILNNLVHIHSSPTPLLGLLVLLTVLMAHHTK